MAMYLTENFWGAGTKLFDGYRVVELAGSFFGEPETAFYV